MLLTKDIFRQIKNRFKGAILGKWRWADYSVKHGELEDKENYTVLEAHNVSRIPIIRKKNQYGQYKFILELDDTKVKEEDKDFICHAKDDVEILINTVDFLQKELNILKKTLEYYCDYYDNGDRAKTALRQD
jgi:hypothetical protein